MCHEIDQDGAIAMASSPGPLVHPDGLGGWTGWQPHAGREPGACVPSQGHADGLQGRDQLTSAPSVHGDQRGQALREDAADACGIAAHEFAHGQPDAHR